MAVSPNVLKRSFSDLEADATKSAKRLKQSYQHHHALQYPPRPIPSSGPAFTDGATVADLLERSIAMVFDHIGVQAADIVTLESFRHDVEEYMFNFLAYVQRSMNASRRVQPMPIDFEFALRGTNILLSSLEPHLNPPVNAYPLQLQTPPPDEVEAHLSQLFLGPELSGEADRADRSFVPSHFPPFPSRHTYRDSAVYTEREKDLRKIRDLATEEGRLGEAALRKLAGAVRSEPLVDLKGKGKTAPKETMESFFAKTVQSVMGEDDKFEFGPIVNSDMVNWRKEGVPTRPRAKKKDSPDDVGDTVMVGD